jgi:hypothetical protein
MKIAGEFNYRNARAVIEAIAPESIREIYSIPGSPDYKLDLAVSDKQRQLSSQLKRWFVAAGWKEEQPAFSVPGMQYDLLKDRLPIEIEIGHERLVFPDFFEFLADYSNGHIEAAIMIVTGTGSGSV